MQLEVMIFLASKLLEIAVDKNEEDAIFVEEQLRAHLMSFELVFARIPVDLKSRPGQSVVQGLRLQQRVMLYLQDVPGYLKLSHLSAWLLHLDFGTEDVSMKRLFIRGQDRMSFIGELFQLVEIFLELQGNCTVKTLTRDWFFFRHALLHANAVVCSTLTFCI